jgi:hypothetical protein
MLWWQFAAERPWFAFAMLVFGAVWLALMWSIAWNGAVECIREMRDRAADGAR